MYVITYKGKPATIAKLTSLEPILYSNKETNNGFIAAASKTGTIEAFLYHFGYTWKERSKGVECEKVIALSALPKLKLDVICQCPHCLAMFNPAQNNNGKVKLSINGKDTKGNFEIESLESLGGNHEI